MLKSNDVSPITEWENTVYPIVLKTIKFDSDGTMLPVDTIVEVWRDDYYQLKGKISGSGFYSQVHSRNKFVGKGNIIVDEKLICLDKANNVVELAGCAFGNLIKDASNKSNERQVLDVELILDSIRITNPKYEIDAKVRTKYEWFLVSGIEAHFDCTTFRKYNEPHIKIRRGVDKYDDDAGDYNGSEFTRDFTILKTDVLECIIAKVPDKYIGGNLRGLCFEFRDSNVDRAHAEFIDDLAHFVGFLFGCELYSTGYTLLHNDQLAEARLKDPRLELTHSQPMPPIHFNMHHDWGKFWLLINKIFPKYLELQEKLQINQAISRRWISAQLPVGTNLPVLASAIEILAGNFLKLTGNDNLIYLSEVDYLEKLGKEFDEIKTRLLEIPDGKIIVNKVLGAFRKGANEKMQKFFSLLDLKIGKSEKTALKLRNKMAHSSTDYTDAERIHEDLISTRVYEVLFNRTVLKLLEYQDFYKDYSLTRSPSKDISISAGNK